LRFIPNILSGDGTEFDPASDPIKAKHLMLQLTDSEQTFFTEYMNADALQRIFELKRMTEGDTPLAKARKNILRNTRVIHHSAQCGNCMYGALSLEIFNKDDVNEDIEYYVGLLRAAAEDYILAHQEDYLPLMLQKTDRPELNESEDQMVIRLRSELEARLRTYCTKVRGNDKLEWGTAMEMEAIAAIIGTPVHVFYIVHPMKLGEEGIEDGVIQPNSIIGGRFTGAPIRLKT
jgi:hypothetical protein